jgi:hypothetical protein
LKLQQRKDYRDLPDLLRHIRNTLHNNGVYFHPDGKPVKFRGRVLNFLVGLMPDILEMIEDVVYSQDIISRN